MRDHRIAGHNVSHRHCVRVDVERGHLEHDVAICDDAHRMTQRIAFIEDDKEPDMPFAHNTGCFGDICIPAN